MMWASLSICSFVFFANAAFDDSGISSFFDECLEEVDDAYIEFEGNVPDYVRGTFVQAGPGRFTMGSMRVAHVFDGFSKYNRVRFAADGSVYFTSKFLRSSYYNESLKSGSIARALLVADTVPPSRTFADLLMARGDNNYIKPIKIGTSEELRGDTPISSIMKNDFKDFDSNIKSAAFMNTPGKFWNDYLDAQMPGRICMTATNAHPAQEPDYGAMTAVTGCQSLVGPYMESYHAVYTIDPSDPSKRNLLAKVPLPNGRPPSYMHSLGFTDDHLVIIAQPMHIDMMEAFKGRTLTGGVLYKGNGTIFQVVNRHDGSYRSYPVYPGFYFAHVLNTWEENGDIFLDITWYPTEADVDFAFMKVFLFENMLNKTMRDSPFSSKIVRFRLTKEGTVEETDLFPEEHETTFELAEIDERKHGKPYCVIYPFQARSNAYDVDKNSKVVGLGGSFAIAKRNICTGERSGFYAANEYPSEITFVPNPVGTDEDDGVLIGLVYNSADNSSFVQVLDAKTMNRIARAPLPVRTGYLLHSSFFPLDQSEDLLVS